MFHIYQLLHNTKKKLDTIQYKSLLIVTGGLKGTSLKALLGECAEIPLYLRRKKSTIKYLVKVCNSTRNSAASILNDQTFYQNELKCKSPYQNQLKNFFTKNNIMLTKTSETYKITPWSDIDKLVDLSMLYNSSLNNHESNIDELLLTLTTKYDTIIFVDGSVKKDGKVGIAIYSPQLPLKLQFRLPDGISIYFAEAYAIFRALLYAKDHNIHVFCLLSDSSRVLNDIKFSVLDKSPHPDIIHHISNIILDFLYPTTTFILKWIPGHSRNVHLQTIDNMAKTASTLDIVQSINYTEKEAILAVDKWIWSIWLKDWENENICKYQKLFKANSISKTLCACRRHDIIISRLRLQQSRLNAGLFKIGLHDSGDCDTCGTLQDEIHFLMHCRNTTGLRKEISRCFNNKKELSFQNLLSDPESITCIIKYVINENVDI